MRNCGCVAIRFMKTSKARRRTSMNSALNRNFSANQRILSKTQKGTYLWSLQTNIQNSSLGLGHRHTNSTLLRKWWNHNPFISLCQSLMQPDKITEPSYDNLLGPTIFLHVCLHKSRYTTTYLGAQAIILDSIAVPQSLTLTINPWRIKIAPDECIKLALQMVDKKAEIWPLEMAMDNGLHRKKRQTDRQIARHCTLVWHTR